MGTEQTPRTTRSRAEAETWHGRGLDGLIDDYKRLKEKKGIEISASEFVSEIKELLLRGYFLIACDSGLTIDGERVIANDVNFEKFSEMCRKTTEAKASPCPSADVFSPGSKLTSKQKEKGERVVKYLYKHLQLIPPDQREGIIDCVVFGNQAGSYFWEGYSHRAVDFGFDSHPEAGQMMTLALVGMSAGFLVTGYWERMGDDFFLGRGKISPKAPGLRFVTGIPLEKAADSFNNNFNFGYLEKIDSASQSAIARSRAYFDEQYGPNTWSQKVFPLLRAVGFCRTTGIDGEFKRFEDTLGVWQAITEGSFDEAISKLSNLAKQYPKNFSWQPLVQLGIFLDKKAYLTCCEAYLADREQRNAVEEQHRQEDEERKRRDRATRQRDRHSRCYQNKLKEKEQMFWEQARTILGLPENTREALVDCLNRKGVIFLSGQWGAVAIVDVCWDEDYPCRSKALIYKYQNTPKVGITFVWTVASLFNAFLNYRDTFVNNQSPELLGLVSEAGTVKTKLLEANEAERTRRLEKWKRKRNKRNGPYGPKVFGAEVVGERGGIIKYRTKGNITSQVCWACLRGD